MASRAVISQRGFAFRGLVTLAGALALAGCNTLLPRGPAGPVERPPVSQQRPSQPTGLDNGIPVDTERNRVALLVPLTGPNAGVGQSLANATQLAQLDTKSERMRITTYDTNLGAATAAQKALADGAQLIIGPLLADDVRAVSPIARAAHVPVLAFSNDTSIAGDGTYVMGYAPAQSIGRVVDYAKSQGVTNYAGLVPTGLYGQRASTAFLRAVEADGGKVVSLQTYDRGAGALAAAVGRLAKNAPYQAVMIPDTGATAAIAVPLIRKASGPSHILGTELWNADTSVAAKPMLNGAWFASVPDALYRQYAAKYRARYGRAPYRLSSLGYDAVLLTVRIMRDWRVGSAFPEAALRDPGGFSGIDGAFRFGRDGVAQRALEVQEIRNGTTAVVSPAPSGF